MNLDLLNAASTKDEVAEELNLHHASHIGMPTAEAKTKFLALFSKWKWAEASFFLVKQSKKTPPSFIFAVTHDRVLFLSTTELV